MEILVYMVFYILIRQKKSKSDRTLVKKLKTMVYIDGGQGIVPSQLPSSSWSYEFSSLSSESSSWCASPSERSDSASEEIASSES